jgi:hypothetical protein
MAAISLDTIRRRSSTPPSRSSTSAAAAATPLRPRDKPLDREWAFSGTSCPRIAVPRVSVQLWLETILAEFKGQGVHDPVIQGQYMRSLISSPLREKLNNKIAVLPAIQAAIDSSTATLADHYATALIACSAVH